MRKTFVLLVAVMLVLATAATAQQKPAFRLGLSIGDASGAYWSTFMGGTQSATITYTLPTAYPGSSGYALTATTAGVMSWAAPAPATHTQSATTGGTGIDTSSSTGVAIVAAGTWSVPTALPATLLQSSAADLGDIDVTVDLSNSHAARSTSVTIDGVVTAGSFSAGVSTGVTSVVTIRDSGGAGDCTMTFTGGILTATTCSHT